MESEKVKEIKKALENNIEGYFLFINENKWKRLRYADILTYINELESENKLLRNAKVVYESVDYCYEDLKKAQDRIAELEEYIKGNQADAKAFVENWHSDLKKELINFAERLKEKATILNSLTYDHRSLSFPETKILDFDDIDETLQECLND